MFAGIARRSTSANPRSLAAAAKVSTARNPHSGSRARKSASKARFDGAARLLGSGAPLILYGPWIEDGVATAPSNLAFDLDLRARDPDWGLREVEAFAAAAAERGLHPVERRAMPANNLMLLLLRD